MNQREALSYLEQPPASGNSPKQLIVFLHGIGADKSDLFPLADELAPFLPDAHFVSYDAPFPYDLAPYGRQWFSLQDRSAESLKAGAAIASVTLKAAIESKLKELTLTFDEVAMIGFSQGGMVALYCSLRWEEGCKGVVSYSGALIDPAGLKDEIQSKPEVCLIHGEADVVVPFIAFEEAYQALQNLDVPVLAYSQQDLGHGIDPAGLQIGAAFLQHTFDIISEK
ncbi:MAG: dienelactone hydrolase family protein [Alphaproteobacteria bacterium]|nr:dienelactone hydrolase family protein [Alphaproteobacteria bacterium]